MPVSPLTTQPTRAHVAAQRFTRTRGIWLAMFSSVVLLALYQANLTPLPTLFTLAQLQALQHDLPQLYAQYPWQTRAILFLLYLVCTTASLPGTVLLNIACGATLGFGWGLLVASFASSIGATLALLLTRRLFRNLAQRRLGRHLERINHGLARNGHWYLFSMRLLPVLPYFVINLAMGLTTMRARTFYWVTQLGMLAATAIYVNAGRELAQLHTLSDVFSPTLVASFTALALLPLIAMRLHHQRSGNRNSN